MQRARADEPTSASTTLQKLIDDRQYEEAIKQGREELPEAADDPQRKSEILHQMAWAAFQAGWACDSEVVDWAQDALVATQEAYGEKSAKAAEAHGLLGLVLEQLCGKYEEARQEQERALALRKEVLPPDDPAISNSLNNLATVLRRLGKFDEAISLLQQALKIREKAYGPEHPKLADAWNSMGNVQQRAGKYIDARNSYEHALAIKEHTLKPDDPSIAVTLICQGVLENTVGDYEASRDCYTRALAICVPSLGEEHPLTLAAHNNLANLLADTGDYEAAIPLYEQTLAGRIERLGPEHPHVAQTHQNLGVLYLKMSELEKARPHFEAALSIMSKSLGEDHPDLANPLESLGNIDLEEGKVEEAYPLVRRTLQLRMKGLGPEHPYTAKTHIQLATALLATGKRSEALKEADLAARILDRHLRETISSMPERQALAMVAAQVHPEAVLFQGLLSANEDRKDWARACWNWTLHQQGRVQEELAWRSRTALDAENPHAKEAWSAYQQARDQLGALWVDGPGDDPIAFSKALEKARETKEKAELELASTSQDFQRFRTFNSVDLDEVQNALGPKERLVEYVQTEVGPSYDLDRPVRDIALLVGPSHTMDGIELGDSSEVDDAVQAWRQALSDAAAARARSWEAPAAMDRLAEASRNLRHMVWDPIRERLDGVETLYLVPTGALQLVNFSALELDDGRFLIEEKPALRMLDSGRDLVRFRDRQPRRRTGTVLALGDVDFDASPQPIVAMATTPVEPGAYRGPSTICQSFAETKWPPLPESRTELNAIVDALNDGERVKLLTGGSASEERLREEAPGKQILHLATHGFFPDEDCEIDSEENPLLLSGLVLAGANRVGDAQGVVAGADGIATAEELAALDLRSVDLAVLSGCDTGRGTVAAGEGVFGLRRAFSIAGASSVVMSLWPTPDDATRAWMTDFYQALDRGEGGADAARSASLTRLHGLRESGVPPHPELWASFVCVGDWH